MNAIWTEERARDIWINNGYPPDKSQVALFPCLYIRYLHISEHTKRACRPCSIGFGNAIRCKHDIQTAGVCIFDESPPQPQPFHTLRPPQNLWHKQLTLCTDWSNWLKSWTKIIFVSMQKSFRCLCRTVCQHCFSPLIKTFPTRLQQRIDRLSTYEINSLEISEAWLVEFSVLAISCWQGPYTIGRDACDIEMGSVLLQQQPDGANQLIGFWCRSLSDAE